MPRKLIVFSNKFDLEEYAKKATEAGLIYKRNRQQLFDKSLIEDLRVILTLSDAHILAGIPYSAIIYRYGKKRLNSNILNYLSSLIREPAHATV